MSTASDMFKKAVNHHRYGNLMEAERIYRQVVSLDPEHADAWHFCGFIGLQLGRVPEAMKCIIRAIELDGEKAVYHANLGLGYRALGDLESFREATQAARDLGMTDPSGYTGLGIRFMKHNNPSGAMACFETALALSPEFAEGHYNVAMAYTDLDKTDQAIAAYRKAVELNPQLVEAYNNLGELLSRAERYQEAIPVLEQAIATKPDHASAHYNLGRCYLGQEQIEKAEGCFQAVLKIDPQHARANHYLGKINENRGQGDVAASHFAAANEVVSDIDEELVNRGVTALEKGDFESALVAFQAAHEAHGEEPAVLQYLGVTLRRLGRLPEAVEALRHSVQLRPNSPQTYGQLAESLSTLGDTNESAVACELALAQDPRNAPLRSLYADCLYRDGRFEDARNQLDVALELSQQAPAFALQRAACGPLIADNPQQLSDHQQELANRLRDLPTQPIISDPYRDKRLRPHLVACQVTGFKAVAEQLAAAQRKVCPALEFTAPHCGSVSTGRIKVGFVSRFFREHPVGRLTSGLIAGLDPAKFDTQVMSITAPSEDVVSRLPNATITTVPDDFFLARDTISQQELDVIVYPEIGIDRLTYDLAFNRLARVQCTTWGHPVTSGLSTIDYYLSAESLEDEISSEQYTEQLVQLSHLPAFVELPSARTLPPSDSGDEEHVYFCLQQLIQLPPDYDEILGEILRQDPHGKILLQSGTCSTWSERLRARLARTIPDVLDRVVFLRPLEYGTYLDTLASSDVVLDLPQYGVVTPVYEALGVNKPLVTLRGNTMRGRVASACYEKLGMQELVANTPNRFIQLAHWMGTDAAARQNMQTYLRENTPALFEDQQAVAQLEEFLLRVGQ